VMKLFERDIAMQGLHLEHGRAQVFVVRAAIDLCGNFES